MVETATFRMFHRARPNPEPLPESDFFQAPGGPDDTARLTENALPARFLQEIRARRRAREARPEAENAEPPVSPAETLVFHFEASESLPEHPASIEEPEHPYSSAVVAAPELPVSYLEPEPPLPESRPSESADMGSEIAASLAADEFDGLPESPAAQVNHTATIWEPELPAPEPRISDAERFLASLDPEEPERGDNHPELLVEHEEHGVPASESEHVLASLDPEEPELEDDHPELLVAPEEHGMPASESEHVLASLDPEESELGDERPEPLVAHEEQGVPTSESEHVLASLDPDEPELEDERPEPLVAHEEHTARAREPEPVVASHDPERSVTAPELPSEPWVPFADWHPAPIDDQQIDWSPANDPQPDSQVASGLALASEATEALVGPWDPVPEQDDPALRHYYHSDPLALDYQLLGLANPIVCTVIGKLGDAAPIRLSAGRTGIYRPDGFRAAPWSGFAYDVSPDGRNGLVVGTRILTARGQIAVEDLVPGDTALALRGPALLPIVWIGRSTAAAPPVQIAANAFGPGRPNQTLCVGADHPIFMENMPVAACDLVNGTSVQTLDPDDVELFQIDVGFPEVLLVEGIPMASGVRWLS